MKSFCSTDTLSRMFNNILYDGIWGVFLIKKNLFLPVTSASESSVSETIEVMWIVVYSTYRAWL